MANYLNIEFKVYTPKNTPENAEVFIVGNTEELGNWQHKVRLNKESDNIYSQNFKLLPDTELEYKFSLGDWQRVEKDINNFEITNRKLTITEDTVIYNTVENWSGFSELESTLTGNIKIIDDFYSPQLETSRRIMIYLPPDYNTEQRYPVLYMHDGNNIFDAKTSFTQVEWQVDENAEELIINGQTRSFIVVGIYNNSDRMNEYTPFYDEIRQSGGKGDKYLSFIVETLKPYVDDNYRTMPDRANTGIAGSSLGGLISLYGIIKHQDIFGFAGVVSPSVWWSNRRILDFVKNADIKNNIDIWVDMGTAEGKIVDEGNNLTDSIINCRALINLLKSKEMIKFNYQEYKDANHSEQAWAGRIADILLYFFKK